MPRIQSTGETLPAPPRGAVTPPPTRFARFARLSATYAGLSSTRTYVLGLVGRSCQYLFGSFQITQRRTYGYRFAAAYAKFANELGLVGAQFAARPPFAQRGAPTSVTTGAMPRARSPPSRTSPADQRYAGSRCDVGFAGRFAAISSQRRLTRTTSTPSASTWSSRS